MAESSSARFHGMIPARAKRTVLPLTTTTLQTLTDCATPVRCRVPAMSDGDYVIIVEAEIDYKPAFSIGLGNQVLRQFVVTRPRFVPRICLSGATCG